MRRGLIPYRSCRSFPTYANRCIIGCTAATPLSRLVAVSAPGGRPVAAVVAAVTSAPFVSCASTLDCWE